MSKFKKYKSNYLAELLQKNGLLQSDTKQEIKDFYSTVKSDAQLYNTQTLVEYFLQSIPIMQSRKENDELKQSATRMGAFAYQAIHEMDQDKKMKLFHLATIENMSIHYMTIDSLQNKSVAKLKKQEPPYFDFATRQIKQGKTAKEIWRNLENENDGDTEIEGNNIVYYVDGKERLVSFKTFQNQITRIKKSL